MNLKVTMKKTPSIKDEILQILDSTEDLEKKFQQIENKIKNSHSI